MTRKKKEVDYSPYCKLCSGCGEDGCCSHIGCFISLIKNPKCEYGESYIRSAMYCRDVAHLCFEIFEKMRKKELTADEAIIDFDTKTDNAYDEIYHPKSSEKTNN